MVNYKKSVNVSIVVCITLAVLLTVLVFLGPMLFELYLIAYRGFTPMGDALERIKTTFVYCFYPSAVFAGIILFALLKLLFNIKKGDTFTKANVTYLRIVSWCCFIVGVITFIGGFFYMPFLLAAFAGGFIGMLLHVLKNVMRSAVEIKEENELTI